MQNKLAIDVRCELENEKDVYLIIPILKNDRETSILVSEDSEWEILNSNDVIYKNKALKRLIKPGESIDLCGGYDLKEFSTRSITLKFFQPNEATLVITKTAEELISDARKHHALKNLQKYNISN